MCIGFGGRDDGGGYKEYRSERARCLGKAVGICIVFHLIFACGRIVSYSFFAALFDLYLVSFGYCVIRRYFAIRIENLIQVLYYYANHNRFY